MLRHRTQVFITSDWHLGGSLDETSDDKKTLGSCIFRSTTELTRFLDSLQSQVESFNGDSHLVLNGDIVDFLAPNSLNNYSPIAWQNDADIICTELIAIGERFKGEDGRGPFAALRDLAANGCQIVVLLGNHDVELCLPKVRDTFVELIGGPASVRFIYDGEAYTCGKLLVEHGNQYDRFNGVDYDMLRRERSQLSRGGSIEDSERGKTYFHPPVGSSIVVDEVNPRLHEVPFLNLLKPEFGAAIPLMLAFYPETRGYFDLAFRTGKIAVRVRKNTQANRPGLLSGTGATTHMDLNSFLREELAEDATAFLGPVVRPGQLSGATSNSGSLMSRMANKASSAMRKACPWLLYTELLKRDEKARLGCVRVALKRVRDATDFAIDSEKDEYRVPAESIIHNGGFEAIVFGHTHFPKEVKLAGGKYLNAGTWADVLRLPEEVTCADETIADKAIERFLKDMREQNYMLYTVRHHSFVRAIVESDGTVDASLQYYSEE